MEFVQKGVNKGVNDPTLVVNAKIETAVDLARSVDCIWCCGVVLGWR